jgi:hypothetical protein
MQDVSDAEIDGNRVPGRAYTEASTWPLAMLSTM